MVLAKIGQNIEGFWYQIGTISHTMKNISTCLLVRDNSIANLNLIALGVVDAFGNPLVD